LGGGFNGFDSRSSFIRFKEFEGEIDLNFDVGRCFLLIIKLSQFTLSFGI